MVLLLYFGFTVFFFGFQLTALQGRKRRKEEINLIDINADDLCGGNDDYLKNLTKESGYQAKKVCCLFCFFG